MEFAPGGVTLFSQECMAVVWVNMDVRLTSNLGRKRFGLLTKLMNGHLEMFQKKLAHFCLQDIHCMVLQSGGRSHFFQ